MKRNIIILILAAMLTAGAASAKSYQFEYQKSVEVTGKPELVVSNTSGSIEITAAPVTDVNISAMKNVRAADPDEAEKIADRIEIRVTKSGNLVRVETNYLKGGAGGRSFWERLFGTGEDSYGGVDYTITVPQECRIEVNNVSGNVTVSGIKEAVNINTTSGDLTLKDITGLVDVETVSGEMALDNIKGDIDISATSSEARLTAIDGMIDIRTTSGDTRGIDINGPVTISQTSGEVALVSIAGNVRIKSTSGDIDIEQESGGLEIMTHSGRVKIHTELNSQKDYVVETSSGNIDFLVPETSSGSVEIETISGTINTRLEMSAKVASRTKFTGEFGKDGPKISLTTASGDVTIGKY